MTVKTLRKFLDKCYDDDLVVIIDEYKSAFDVNSISKAKRWDTWNPDPIKGSTSGVPAVVLHIETS